MDLLDTARELAEALTASEAFAAYEEAEIDFLNDDQVQALVERLEALRARWRELADAAPEEAGLLARRLDDLEAEARANVVYRRYQAARGALESFIGAVLDEVSYLISGTTRRDLPCGGGDRAAPQGAGPAFDLARRLGEQLRATEQYRRLVEAEQALLRDDEVRAWVAELQAAEERLRRLDCAASAEGPALKRRVEELKALIAAHPRHAALLEARERFDRLMGLVLDTIGLGISGGRRAESGCGTSTRACGCGSGLYLPPPARIRRVLAVTG